MPDVCKKFFENDRVVVVNPSLGREHFQHMYGTVSNVEWHGRYQFYIYSVDFDNGFPTQGAFLGHELGKLKTKKYIKYLRSSSKKV